MTPGQLSSIFSSSGPRREGPRRMLVEYPAALCYYRRVREPRAPSPPFGKLRRSTLSRIEIIAPKSGLPLDSIDFLALHFQVQPPLFGRRQLLSRHGERLGRGGKPAPIARIQVRVVQDGIQPGNSRL
jgi:hypothetical protein